MGIQLHLLETAKNKFIDASDILEHLMKPEVQEQLHFSTNMTQSLKVSL